VVLDAIVRRLEERNFRVDRPTASNSLESYSRRLIIPSFTDESVSAGTGVQSVLELRGGGVGSEFDQFRVGRAVYTVVADLAVLKATGQPVTADGLKALASAPRRVTLAVHALPGNARSRRPGFSQAVPGTYGDVHHGSFC
jgi:hypothetical protein